MKVLLAARDYLPRVGGLQMSVHQLAERLPDASVYTLLDPSARHIGDQVARVVRRATGRELVRRSTIGTVPVHRTTSSAGATAVIDRTRPDAVVANAGALHTHDFVRSVLDAPGRHLRCLYVRDVGAVDLARDVSADLLLANCEELARQMRERARRHVEVVPSVIEVGTAARGVFGGHILYINPVDDRGLELAIEVAGLLPDLQFRFQESWPIAPPRWELLEQRLRPLANVELRRATYPQCVYEGAGALIVPYLVPNRPRVVLEAMAASVPVIGAASGGVAEAIDGAGLVVGIGAGADRWAQAVRRATADRPTYDRLVVAGHHRLWAPDVDPEALAQRFASLLEVAARSSIRTVWDQ